VKSAVEVGEIVSDLHSEIPSAYLTQLLSAAENRFAVCCFKIKRRVPSAQGSRRESAAIGMRMTKRCHDHARIRHTDDPLAPWYHGEFSQLRLQPIVRP